MARDTSKTKLSRHLLDMKFMKKSKEKAQKDEEDEEHRSLYNSDAVDTIIKEGSRYIIQESYAPCLDLVLPRMSFKGRNPEIERLMQGENEKELPTCKMPGIPDEEMAERYSTLVGTMAKKFDERKKATLCSQETTHKAKVLKRFKFQRPSDD
nr:M-phase phosphoprotein 6-like [Rhipicephalus microplus]